MCDLKRKGADLGNRFAIDGDRQNRWREALPLTTVARHGSMKRTEAFLGPLPFCLRVLALDIRQHSLETAGHRHLSAVPVPPFDDDFVVVAVQHRVLYFFAQVLPRCVQTEVEVDRETLGEPLEVGVNQFFSTRLPGQDHTLPNRHRRVVENQIDIRHRLRADAMAGHTGPERRVERESARFDLGQGDDVLVGAGELFTVRSAFVAVNEVDDQDALTQFQCGLDRIVESGRVSSRRQTVYHDRDVVLKLLFGDRQLGQLNDLTVHQRSGVTLSEQIGEHLNEFTLSTRHDRCQNLKARLDRKRGELVRNLLRRLAFNLFSTLGTVRNTDSRPQQSHVVVNLGDRAHRRSRVSIRGFLVDRHCG